MRGGCTLLHIQYRLHLAEGAAEIAHGGYLARSFLVHAATLRGTPMGCSAARVRAVHLPQGRNALGRKQQQGYRQGEKAERTHDDTMLRALPPLPTVSKRVFLDCWAYGSRNLHEHQLGSILGVQHVGTGVVSCTVRLLTAISRFARPKTVLWFTVSTVMGFSALLLSAPPPARFFFVLLPIILLNVGAIITNDIADFSVDRHSPDPAKTSRPLVSGLVNINEAIVIASLSFGMALIMSAFISRWTFLFSVAITILAVVYSLPPFKLSSSRLGSLLFWPFMCVVCYAFWICLVDEAAPTSPEGNLLWRKPEGWMFLGAVVTFMGVGEIISKDLRDLDCDRLGGRRTFVESLKLEHSTRLMALSCWLGAGLWVGTLYMAGRTATVPSVLLLIVSVDWCIKLTRSSQTLRQAYDRQLAMAIHEQWTRVYAVMQFLTAATFIV